MTVHGHVANSCYRRLCYHVWQFLALSVEPMLDGMLHCVDIFTIIVNIRQFEMAVGNVRNMYNIGQPKTVLENIDYDCMLVCKCWVNLIYME